jgi:hypothetical protein
MITGISEKERAFVDELRADTGRDLPAWMAAIEASGLAHRNDIIDWLRQEGFTFSKASWLERIHHNGGRLIYGEPTEKQAPSVAKRKAPDPPAVRPLQSRNAEPRPDADIDVLLAAAKAYRPLAQVLLRDILAAVPGADASAQGGMIVIGHSKPFAAIHASSKDVRLMIGLTTARPGEGWQKAKLPSALENLSGMTHMLVLTDARQLTRELKDLIAAAANETGG